MAEKIHQGEPYDTHHLFAAYAHQLVEEGREGRHAHGGDEPHELYVFRLYAQSACHFAAVGCINATYGEDGDKQQYQQYDAQRLGYPVVERVVLIFCPIGEAYRILFHDSKLFCERCFTSQLA